MKKIIKKEVRVWGEEAGVPFRWVSLFRLCSAGGRCAVPDAAYARALLQSVSGARPQKVMWHDWCPRSLRILKLQRWCWQWHWLVGGFWRQNLLSTLTNGKDSMLICHCWCHWICVRSRLDVKVVFENVKSRFRQSQSCPHNHQRTACFAHFDKTANVKAALTHHTISEVLNQYNFFFNLFSICCPFSAFNNPLSNSSALHRDVHPSSSNSVLQSFLAPLPSVLKGPPHP